MASFAQLTAPSTEGLPSSITAEIAILGAMLLDAVAISDATGRLRVDDFSLDSHRRVFQAVLDLMAVGHAVDHITVMEALSKRKELDSIGGPAYLAYLTEGIPHQLNIESYVRIVKDKSLLRQLMGIFHEGVSRASDQSELAADVLGDVEAPRSPTPPSSAAFPASARSSPTPSARSTLSTSRAARSPALPPTTSSSTA